MIAQHPKLKAPDLSAAFPHARPLGDGRLDQTVFHDPDLHPVCGYISREEAAILYHIALAVPGVWLEIGSFVGWSAAHIAAAGSVVIAVDREYATATPIRTRAHENLVRAQLNKSVEMIGQTSEEYFREAPLGYFDGIFIDGDHDAPQPLLDAQRALPTLDERGVIMFHDFSGQPIKDAVNWLFEQGFGVKVYKTAAGLAACWRGGVHLPEHP